MRERERERGEGIEEAGVDEGTEREGKGVGEGRRVGGSRGAEGRGGGGTAHEVGLSKNRRKKGGKKIVVCLDTFFLLPPIQLLPPPPLPLSPFLFSLPLLLQEASPLDVLLGGLVGPGSAIGRRRRRRRRVLLLVRLLRGLRLLAAGLATLLRPLAAARLARGSTLPALPRTALLVVLLDPLLDLQAVGQQDLQLLAQLLVRVVEELDLLLVALHVLPQRGQRLLHRPLLLLHLLRHPLRVARAALLRRQRLRRLAVALLRLGGRLRDLLQLLVRGLLLLLQLALQVLALLHGAAGLGTDGLDLLLRLADLRVDALLLRKQTLPLRLVLLLHVVEGRRLLVPVGHNLGVLLLPLCELVLQALLDLGVVEHHLRCVATLLLLLLRRRGKRPGRQRRRRRRRQRRSGRGPLGHLLLRDPHGAAAGGDGPQHAEREEDVCLTLLADDDTQHGERQDDGEHAVDKHLHVPARVVHCCLNNAPCAAASLPPSQ
eukprot:Rhum_TRINITY_DN14326_c9_g1::Rhum_TRINITY_DN14326_c9_g1_i1::g.85033::m.85033